jgi:hypothetical protein
VLADAFCRVLGQTFGDPSPPPDSWWTTDYHLDWLAGASLWRKEHPCEIHVGRVTGTIGDVDIIVAAPDYLYLIEAKAAGSWNNGQLIRKVKLLDEICPGGCLTFSSLGQSVRVRFGLLSIGRVKRVSTDGWPEWMLQDDRPFVLDLQGPGRQNHLTVQRVSDRGVTPLRWKIVETKY